MKKLLFLLLLFPLPSFALWNDSELMSNWQLPTVTGYMSCYKKVDGKYGLGNAYTTNANFSTAAGTSNVKVGFSPTTNIYTNADGYRESKGNAAITFTKAINIYYTYAGQNKTATIPANTYWGNPTSSWRTAKGDAVAWIPSTGLANSLRLTSYSYVIPRTHGLPYGYQGGYLKVTVTLPNGSPANFYLDC